jgi:hypothetical protein
MTQSNSLWRVNKTLFAEELGVHYGNGSLFDDRRWYKCGFDVYGDLYDDQPYLEFHVSKLIEDCYGTRPKSYIHPRSATLILRTLSRNALSVKEHVGLHPGRKEHLPLPEFCRVENGEVIAPFVRGLVDIEGSLRFRKQFRDRHYYPVLECEMGDSSFIRALYTAISDLKIPVAFRVRAKRLGQVRRRTKASFYVSGWNSINAWLDRFGLANPKHLSKLLVAEKCGFCPPHTSLDQRLGIIAGELDPASFYERRLGDADANPRYQYAHEVLVLRIASRPRLLVSLVREMKIRGRFTEYAISKLAGSRDIQLRESNTGIVIEATRRGLDRLRNLYRAWEELKSRFHIAIPDTPFYCPAKFEKR